MPDVMDESSYLWLRRLRRGGPAREHEHRRRELAELVAGGPKTRTEWLRLGYTDVLEVDWLPGGTALLAADGTLYLPLSLVLPDGWVVWPHGPVVGWLRREAPSA